MEASFGTHTNAPAGGHGAFWDRRIADGAGIAQWVVRAEITSGGAFPRSVQLRHSSWLVNQTILIDRLVT
ncbi:MAG: hypothetical protein ACOH1R_03225 [Luteimonas sp.]